MSAPRGRFRRAVAAFIGLVAVSVVAGIMITASIAPAIAITGVATTNGIGLFEKLPSDLKIEPLQQKTEIYAKNGKKNQLIATFYNQNRDIITWADVPQTVKNATIAAEDIRYYEHGAVDPTGIVRAAIQDVMHKDVQGASTITQQYVKNVCVQEAERLSTAAAVAKAAAVCTGGLSRKVQEARYAIGLEKKYTKNQILLAYLNIVGFGGRVYGIESAAQYYFGVHAKDLTNAQAASLMAIVNYPDDLRLDEKANLPANLVRRNYVLTQEHKHKLISDADFAKAIATPLKPKITATASGCNQAGVAGFFCDYVTRVIQQDPEFGKTAGDRYNNLTSAGWKIYTTLDMKLQKTAQSTMNAHVPMKTSVGNIGSTAVTVQVGTGRVLAMVQNKKFNNDGNASSLGSQYTSVNYNTDYKSGGSSGFQPGSTYKLFTLLDWLKQGHTLDEIVNGDPGTFPASDFTQCGATYQGLPWSVGNDEASERGKMSVRTATALSVNGAFAYMGTKLDLCDIRTIAKDLGVKRADGKTLEDYSNSIIGTNTVTPLSMANAYAGVADNGKTCSPIVVDKVVEADGSDLAVPKSSCTQAVDKQVAIAAASALRSVITSGTMGGDETSDGVYEIGKTGTTDNAYDTWAIGSSSTTTTAVWVGSVSGHVNLRSVYSFPFCSLEGGTTQAAVERHCIWRDIQTEANKLYGGSKSWPQPETQYISGASATVPNVVGLSKASATSVLQNDGFTVATDSAVDSSVAAGLIATQSPNAGSSASPGATVTIAPSSGSAPASAPPAQTGKAVPAVVGSQLGTARTALAGAGFTQVSVNYLQRTPGGSCLVTSSNPVQGTTAPTSQTIQLAVAGSRQTCG